MAAPQLKLIECPRDAMQGIEPFIPTQKKVAFLQQLLQVGFDTIDFGSFVSPKAIPQLRDTTEVLAQLDLSETNSKLLAIVANLRGAEDACRHPEIDFLGFPFSISETFQQRNTNSSREESLQRISDIAERCDQHGKELVVYISMAFGNHYGDPWNRDVAQEWTGKLIENYGIKTIALADTVGVSNPENIRYLFEALIPHFPEVEFGAHLHSNPNSWKEKVEAAYQSGCHRFDSALKGYGGCPMAEDDLVGNLATENVLRYFKEIGIETGLNTTAFADSMALTSDTFPF